MAAVSPDRRARPVWALARALVEFNAELRPRLKKLGYLTRDPRAA
jgi:ribosomal protein S9